MSAEESVIVVGAGLAGAACARALREAGAGVVVVDKAPVVGGRLASRRLDGVLVDHGAPYLTARAAPFGRWLERLTAEGQLVRAEVAGQSRHGAREGVREVVRALLAGIEVRTEWRVTTLAPRGGRVVTSSERGELTGAHVVVTAPVPQAVELLGAGATGEPGWRALAKRLHQVHYDRCLVGLFRQDGGSAQAAGWGDQEVDDAVLSSLGVERWKGREGALGVVSRARADVSETRHGEPDESLLDELHRAARRFLPSLGPPATGQLKRWRYARVRAPRPELFARSDDGRVLVAGDGFGHGDAEAAFVSGQAAAAWLLAGREGGEGSAPRALRAGD